MRSFSWRRFLLVGLVISTFGAVAAGQGNSPTAEQLLGPAPTAKGVVVAYTTPTKAELAQCKVEFVNSPRGGAWVLKDGQGRLVRRFAYTGGSKAPNEISYFRDGFEVYREVQSPGKNAADRFLWLGWGGSKIGLDTTGDQRIDTWQAISVEELSQEVVRAVVAKDWSVYQPLLISEAELTRLGAPAREVNRIRELHQTAPKRFEQVVSKLAGVNASTKWLHLETGSPSRILSESSGMKGDVLMYYRALILIDTNGKTETIQLGEIVQVGECWKLLDAPLLQSPDAGGVFAAGTEAPTPKVENPELQKQLEALAELDKQAPALSAANNATAAKYHLQRAGQIEKIFALAPDAEKVEWLKQLVDSLSAAAQAGEAKAQERLETLAGHFAKTQAGSAVAAYVNYRAITAAYASQMAAAVKADAMLELQKQYLVRLEQFVTAFPKAEESAEALLQLGMMLEFQNKEDDAKKWYQQLAQSFNGTKQADKAVGALRRINLVGKPWEPPADAVALTAGGFNPAALRGNTVVVYYWATWSQSSAADFRKLQELLKTHASKRLTLVAINVDENRAEALAFLNQHKPAGVHLHAGGGLESQAVQHYGLFVFPNLFLIGPDGKTLAHAIDVSGIEAELNPPPEPKK